MAAIIEVDFFNSYLLKKVTSQDGAQQPPQVKLAGASGIGSLLGIGTPQPTFPSPAGSTGVQPYGEFYPGTAYPGFLRNGYQVRFLGNDGTNNVYTTTPWNINWFVEEARIRGGFNNTSTDYGARAYLDDPEPLQQHRFNSLIYSGIYNSRTGINQTNVFSVADTITRSADPVNGSIQYTHAEDTNLLVFQENKVSRALIDKDTIYTAEGGTQTQSGAKVIGQIVPYKGEYGISTNPESFAYYGYRKYFSDRNRNSIMRLSNDGLTEISTYGMQDFFRDELALINEQPVTNNVDGQLGFSTDGTSIIIKAISSTLTGEIVIGMGFSLSADAGNSYSVVPGYIVDVKIVGLYTEIYFSELIPGIPLTVDTILRFFNKASGRIIGGFDIHNKNYVVSLQQKPPIITSGSFKTITFDEKINGWVSFMTFKPTLMGSLKNKFYSLNKEQLYLHYDNTVANNRGKFYGVQSPANVTFVFNPNSSVMKNFKTISYQGSNGWEVTSFVSGFEGFDPDPTIAGAFIQNQDKTTSSVTSVSVLSYEQGAYDALGRTGLNASALAPPLLRAGFNRKENRYVANLISESTARAGEVIFGNAMTGIKGYFATVTIETDNITQYGGPKELWAAASEFVVSSN
tara:strand:+ start:6758 stop:8644 length:1887 start_codon:yes stop_codon:yes gene_type:complete